MNSFKAPADFALLVTQVEPRDTSDLEEKQGLSLGRADSKQAASDPNFKRCDNCRKFVPIASFTMHSAVCYRNNWCCPICLRVMPKKDKDSHAHCVKCGIALHSRDIEKHMDFAHKLVTCECGLEMEIQLLETHKAETCVFRIVSCKYCDAKMPLSLLADHESLCGGKTVVCSRCSFLLTCFV